MKNRDSGNMEIILKCVWVDIFNRAIKKSGRKVVGIYWDQLMIKFVFVLAKIENWRISLQIRGFIWPETDILAGRYLLK